MAHTGVPAIFTPALVALSLLLDPPVQDADAPQLDTVEVRSTRLRRVDPFRQPASLSVIDLDGDSNRPQLQLSEVLGAVPGVLARERQNLAQDTQLAIRGFGARSTFGVRGVRLYADGIPATLPDGQGQLAHFSLLGGERVEVLRGPFSALYGNSAGGVVLIESAGGSERTQARALASVGSHHSSTLGVQLRGSSEQLALGYNLAALRFVTDGYREHSAATRELLNLKLELGESSDTRQFKLLLNHFRAPQALDPLGLTAAQVQADPRQAPLAQQFNTRKTTAQDQLGLVWDEQLTANQRLQLSGYAGRRAVEQYLSVPVAAQANPLNSGGVIDLQGDYSGGDLRWSFDGAWAERKLQGAVGLNYEQLRQQRRGYENFVGSGASSELGRRGALRRSELGEVSSTDVYAQLWWELGPRWAMLGGLRHSEVDFDTQDYFITTRNPDDSGAVRYSRSTPVLGLSWAVRPDLNLHVSAGRGFETPTFNELSYRADGGSGLALDLDAASSRNLELGGKWRDSSGRRLEVALFRAHTDNEIAVARNVAGRSSFRNVGRTRRQGLETALTLPLGEAWSAELAYTRLDARFSDAITRCDSNGCAGTDTLVAAGSRLPGVPRDQGQLRLQWSEGDFSSALELVGVGAVTVNDAGTQGAAGYALLNLELARSWSLSAGDLRSYVRIDNLLDHRHIGSVIVNEGNGRFFEPGAQRSFWLGAQWRWRD